MRMNLSCVFGKAFSVGGIICSLTAATSAWGQPQDKAQQACINQLNKGSAFVAATQGKENVACVLDAGKARLLTAEACLTADRKSKVAKAVFRNAGGEIKKCTVPPDFGATDAATGSAAAVEEEISLLHDIYGPNLDAAVIDAFVDRIGASCQAAVVKAYEKLMATKLKEFLACKRNGLSAKTSPPISSSSDLASCLSGRSDSIAADAKGRIDKARAKLAATVMKKCKVSNSSAFPGVRDSAFPGLCTLSNNFAQCVDERVECRVCLMLNTMDNLGADCDTFDDGMINDSCP